MTEEQKRQKEYNEDLKKRIAADIQQYQSLDENGKKEFIKRRLRNYEECPEKRKYEIQLSRPF